MSPIMLKNLFTKFSDTPVSPNKKSRHLDSLTASPVSFQINAVIRGPRTKAAPTPMVCAPN